MLLEFFTTINKIDIALILWVQRNLASPYLDSFFYFITDLNKTFFFQVFVILPLILFWIYKERKEGLYKLIGLIVTLTVIDSFCGLLIKKIVARPRPFNSVMEIVQKSPASGYSFVSNHAANMVGIAVYLGYLYPKMRFFWWFLAILIGFSRLYNGVHYISDIIVGGLIGGAFSFFMVKNLNKQFKLVKR